MARLKRISKKVLFAKTVAFLQPQLNLQDWKILVRYSYRMKATADCQAWPEYKQAVIRLNLKNVNRFNHYEIIMIAIHEMMHCLVWPLADWAEKLCKKDPIKKEITRQLDEALVTNLEKILTDLTCTSLQSYLNEQGYADLDLIFNNFHAGHAKEKK